MNDARSPATARREAASPEAVLTAVGELATAAEQAALVRLALSSGLLQQCLEPATVQDLAGVLQAPQERLAVVCDALVAMGALFRDGARVRLSPAWSPLAREGVHVTLERALAGAAARQPVIAATLSPSPDYWQPDYWQMDTRQRLDLADGVTLATTTGFGRAVVSGVVRALPEVEEELRAGARWLELGCGVAGMLLGIVQDHPKATAVGVDLAGDLVAVASERARELGVADRVDFVRADATTYTDDEPFDIVFWSQFFFPAGTRRAALANAFERLRPGGLLLCPIVPGDLEPYHSGSTLAQQASLHALVFSGWGVPILSGDALADELRGAGFRVRRVHRDGLPVIMVAERPGA